MNTFIFITHIISSLQYTEPVVPVCKASNPVQADMTVAPSSKSNAKVCMIILDGCARAKVKIWIDPNAKTKAYFTDNTSVCR